MTRALRTLLGLDPSAGSVFDRSVEGASMDSDEEDAAGSATAQDDADQPMMSTAAAVMGDSDIPARTAISVDCALRLSAVDFALQPVCC